VAPGWSKPGRLAYPFFPLGKRHQTLITTPGVENEDDDEDENN
jgi:hypothetical protein